MLLLTIFPHFFLKVKEKRSFFRFHSLGNFFFVVQSLKVVFLFLKSGENHKLKRTLNWRDSLELQPLSLENEEFSTFLFEKWIFYKAEILQRYFHKTLVWILKILLSKEMISATSFKETNFNVYRLQEKQSFPTCWLKPALIRYPFFQKNEKLTIF